MKTHSKIWNYICYAGLSKEEFVSVKDRVSRSNWRMLFLGENIFLIAMIISAMIRPIKVPLHYLTSFYSYFYSKEFLYFSLGIACFFLMLLTLLAKGKAGLTKLLVYLFCLLLYIYAIWTTLQNPSSQATTIMVFLVLLPTIFVIAPWKQLLTSLFLVVFFNYLALEFKTANSIDADAWNSVFFGAVGVISGFYFDHVMLVGWLDAEKSKFLSENDLLTGIRNRNYYQQEINTLLKEAKESVTFVFCDVNGLHETNNKFGHEAGDRMLIALASELADSFGQDMSFRFGGDEFLAIALDEPLDQVQEKCDRLLLNLQKQGYHVSLGIKQEKTDHLNVGQLLYQADKVMRKSKEEFYKKAENDRRAR